MREIGVEEIYEGFRVAICAEIAICCAKICGLSVKGLWAGESACRASRG